MTLRAARAARIGFATLALFLAGHGALGANAPGVTSDEIKFGQTLPLSGPASAYSVLSRTEAAYFKMINERGGVNGRKLNFLSADDAYSPPRTLEQTRRLVEQEQVAFVFNGVGTAASIAVRPYFNENKVPQLFAAFGVFDNKGYPWTVPFFQPYDAEAAIYAKYALAKNPNAKIAVLYQNDDLGKSYLKGFVDGLGAEHAGALVKSLSFEVSEPTVDSQVTSLQGSGADVLFIAASPKFTAQAIRKSYDLGWDAMRFIAVVAATVPTVLKPAGLEKSKGVITAITVKDVSDLRWKDEEDVKQFQAFVAKYLTPADATSNAAAYAYQSAALLVYVLQACGDDLSRENILAKATHIEGLTLPLGLPGLKAHNSPDDYRLAHQFQLEQFDGESWKMFGDLIDN
jgi:branched-chain amino acid transport system substrate-binding protein